MKKHILIIIILLITYQVFGLNLDIIYPKEGSYYKRGYGFIFGNISPKEGRLYINDQTVDVHKDGGFITYLKLNDNKNSNKYTFNCKLIYKNEAKFFKRNVFFNTPSTNSDYNLQALSSPLIYNENVIIDKQKDIIIEVEGKTNCKGNFLFVDKFGKPLTETFDLTKDDKNLTMYKGKISLKEDSNFTNAFLMFSFIDCSGDIYEEKALSPKFSIKAKPNIQNISFNLINDFITLENTSDFLDNKLILKDGTYYQLKINCNEEYLANYAIIGENSEVFYQNSLLNENNNLISKPIFCGIKDNFKNAKLRFDLKNKNGKIINQTIDNFFIQCEEPNQIKQLFEAENKIKSLVCQVVNNEINLINKKDFSNNEIILDIDDRINIIFKENGFKNINFSLIDEENNIIYKNIPLKEGKDKNYYLKFNIGQNDSFKKGSIIFKYQTLNGKTEEKILNDLKLTCKSETNETNQNIITFKKQITVEIDSLFPQSALIINQKDNITLEVKGSANCDVSCKIVNDDGTISYDNIKLVENTVILTGENTISGIYKANLINITKTLNNARIFYTFTNKNGETITKEAQGFINTLNYNIPQIVELKEELNIARPEVGLAYYLFLPKGVRAKVDGKKDGFIRLNISKNQDVWVSQKNVSYLKYGTLIPKSTIPLVKHTYNNNKSKISINLNQKQPYLVEYIPELKQIKLKIYSAYSDTDWITIDDNDKNILRFSWDQKEEDIYELTINLAKNNLWGYDIYYEDAKKLAWKSTNQNYLSLELTFPKKKFIRFADLKICVDAGHSADPGAVGTTGLLEKDVNLSIALKLKKLLDMSFAKVVLTRDNNNINVTLNQRKEIAIINNCDMFVSIHNNALPDGVNPYENNGTSSIYFYPQSKRLSELMLSSLVKQTNLKSYGLFYGNINVLRLSQMPASLVECAFMMIPEQEALLKDDFFQQKCAFAIYQGILKFIWENNLK